MNARIVIALLAGPITWDHDVSWALLPIIGSAAYRNRVDRPTWLWLVAIAAVLLILAAPTLRFRPETIELRWWLRPLTSVKAVGLLDLFFFYYDALRPITDPSKS